MPAEMEQRLRQIRLRTRYPVEHLLAGEYRSVFKGRGMDFDEIRPYEPGDDVRAIDWNVTARMGHPHLKRYVEERELAVWFVVDTSASCRCERGERTKWEVMHEIVALLTLSATRNQDRVGLILFSDRVEAIIPPRKGRPHALRLLSDLLRAEPRGRRTDPQPALEAVAHLAQRRSLVFWVSDFLFDADRDRLGPVSFRQDLVAVAVNDLREKNPPACGLVSVEDSETGDSMICVLDHANREVYGRAFDQRRAALKRELEAAGADLIECDTESNCAAELAGFFRRRMRRAANETGG
ncbi:DUF58 domain-containing protein [Kiritimatiella glycovorans]|uniref:DUF58 domain-containing protein n=1 Tax=Kiritimatiella glycovorans TaxID=1307763 RepID=A0A0G3ECN3_9BACT|nr:DUF58 domain-containing protein [Kiritimatiella glycovorans]AKJ64266.1 hypothetical protein L21SP4_01007 [Kiritimatiella glycovorans]